MVRWVGGWLWKPIIRYNSNSTLSWESGVESWELSWSLTIALSMISPFSIWVLYFLIDTSALTPDCMFWLIPIFVKLRAHGKIVQVSLEKFYGIILQTHLLPQENKFGHNIFTFKIYPKLLDGKQTHGDWKCQGSNWHKYCQAQGPPGQLGPGQKQVIWASRGEIMICWINAHVTSNGETFKSIQENY